MAIYNKNSVIRGALRRAFARSPHVKSKMDESRREIPRYKNDGSRHKKNFVQRQCELCKEWCSSSKMAVDHITPVVSVDEGFQDWNEFVDRLWCDNSNLQRLCDTCHDAKTQKEKIERLTIKYNRELDIIEQSIKSNGLTKDIEKILKKYIQKKKNPNFQSIAARATSLKTNI